MKYVLIAMLLLFTSYGEYKVIIECEDPEWCEDVVEEWHDYNN